MAVTMRLVVDFTRCRGHGICTVLFAERAELDEWGFPVIDPADLDSAPLVRRARRAVVACPRGALSVETSEPR